MISPALKREVKMKKQSLKMAAAVAFVVMAGIMYCLFGRGGTTVSLEAELSGEITKPAAETSDTGQEGEDGIAVSEEAPTIFVYVCGEVNSPGVYELPEGSRLFEAVEAAGGFTEDADERVHNLALLLKDGAQITVYSRSEAETLSAALRYGASGESPDGLININTASKAELMTLPGIGEAKADDIIRYRESNGDFKVIEDIMKVSGIKDAGFQKIKDRITV